MAALTDVNAELLSQVQAALTAAGINATTCLYYPTDDMIEAVASSKVPLVAIYLRTSTFYNKNMRYRRETDPGVCGIAATLPENLLLPGQSVSLTLAYAIDQSAVQVNDGVAFYVRNGNGQIGASYNAVSGDTLNSVATGLAAAINTNFANNSITASANVAVVTITNSNETIGYQAATATGNVSTAREAVQWASRSYQIIAYSADLDDREAIQECIENVLAAADDNYGFYLTSGEAIRIKMTGGKSGDADTQKDIYRDDFIFTVDHAVDAIETLYAILMPSFTVDID
jgi:hypothetical protein